MKAASLLLALVTVTAATSAQTDRYATVRGDGPAQPGQISIAPNEVGELLWANAAPVTLISGSVTNTVYAANQDAGGQGCIVAGPALFSTDSGPITVRIFPSAFPPDKTVILPPGTNQVYVGLESSTNLVHWSPATNGIYGSPDEARFFRIHMQNQ